MQMFLSRDATLGLTKTQVPAAKRMTPGSDGRSSNQFHRRCCLRLSARFLSTCTCECDDQGETKLHLRVAASQA